MNNNYSTFLLLTLVTFIFTPRQTNAQTIAGGGGHSLSICTNDTLMSWGLNDNGQLGDGTTIDQTSAVTVTGINAGIAVAGGANHSLALRSNGTVWAWGSNTNGQLGDGTTVQKTLPTQVIGLNGMTAIASGWNHSLSIASDSTVWSWGSNWQGQLGNNSLIDEQNPVQVLGLTEIIAIAGGGHHSLALRSDGTVWTWGSNDYGQLGDGTFTQKTTPVQVNGLFGIIAIAGGGVHSLALRSDGTVWSWGSNTWGQLGDGTTIDQLIPVQVSGLAGITNISGGGDHSLALRSDSTGWAWGSNYYGQLGDGTTTDRIIPVQVNGPTEIVTIVLGGWHSLFLKNDGTLWACGMNFEGQLGDGTTITPSIVVQTINLCNVKQPGRMYPYYISGFLYNDINTDCLKQFSEQGFPFCVVKATPEFSYASSNDTGYYSLGVHDSVNYTITPIIPSRFSNMISNPCPGNYTVFLDSTAPMDTSGFDFGFEFTPCPLLRVDISSNRRRRCFRNTTTVFYINEGLADTSGVEIHVKMPEFVIPVGSSIPYTWSSDSNMVFNIDTLNAGESGYITIIDSVACVNGITGLSQCTRAWITPANECVQNLDTNITSWDKSSVLVDGACVQDSVAEFFIINTGDPGTGDMQGPSEYRVFVNTVLAFTDSFQLNGGDTLHLHILANGNTIRLEADQRPFHPGNSQPNETIENCGDSLGTVYLGFLPQMPPDDFDPEVEEDCLPIIDSYDPNDKQVNPEGITTNKYVPPSTLLDYKIRFQNTGSDTAYKVVVVDTLSEHLDLATLELGVSSFPYQIALSGEGKPVLTFTFNNINLPDSATDELNSQGFVKFKIAPYDTVPIGTVVNNIVDIYFDFNLPIRTNTAWITIHDTTLTGATATVIRCDTTTAPVLSFNFQDSTICAGDPIQIMASGADAYYWYQGDYINDRTISDPLVYPTVTQVYQLEAALNNSCFTAKDSVSVGIIPLPDVSVSQSNDTLLSNNPNADYEWFNCDNATPPSGNISDQIFIATENGNYAVILTENGCVDTSACYSMTNVNVEDYNFAASLQIFPNPVNHTLSILIGEATGVSNVQLFNMLGTKVREQNFINSSMELDMQDLPAGVYMLKVISGEQQAMRKVVKW